LELACCTDFHLGPAEPRRRSVTARGRFRKSGKNGPASRKPPPFRNAQCSQQQTTSGGSRVTVSGQLGSSSSRARSSREPARAPLSKYGAQGLAYPRSREGPLQITSETAIPR